eukprot:3577590-Prymnesium_polylepis.1
MIVVAAATPLRRIGAQCIHNAGRRGMAAECAISAVVCRQVRSELCNALQEAALLLGAKPQAAHHCLHLKKVIKAVLLAWTAQA